jgi:hypothetical protein
MSSFDDWRTTDKLADEMATYAAKHEALSTQIRLNLSQSDYQREIEVDSSFDPKVCQAITEAFKTGTDCGAILHQYANDWLTKHAEALATQRLNGEME